jgi:hypothetical protein
MKAIKNPKIIIGAFICLKVIQAAYAFAVGESPSFLPYLRFGEIIILALIFYFALQKKTAALWVMGIFLLTQIFAVLWAIFLIPIDQYIFKTFAVLLSMYFVYGGYVLINLARGKKKVEA